MEIFEHLARRDHEEVVFCSDTTVGLRAIIAIHNTTLGPALGGTRMWNYESEDEALRDVLRLSRGMTYKAAAAGLNLGGGKAVIIGDPNTMQSEELFRSFGRFVDGLGGRYITAEDVGTSVRVMEWVRMETDYVTGIDEELGGSGDPSPVTALGVFHGIRASAKYRWDTEDLTGKRVAIQGLGHVGYYLAKELHNAGAELIVTDIDEDKIRKVVREFGAEGVEHDDIYGVEAEVFAPCALGGVVNDETLQDFRFEIIAGAANNQLENEKVHGQALRERDILYAPDYVINAGGLINVANEMEGYHRQRALKQAGEIYNVLLAIFREADEQDVPTYQASNHLAEQRIKSIGHLKEIYSSHRFKSIDRRGLSQ